MTKPERSSPLIGITGCCPIEVIYAAGARVLDLNNAFISSPHPRAQLEEAERFGFSATQCAWTRGIFGVAAEKRGAGEIDGVVVVARGDCSQNRHLADLLPLATFDRRSVHLFEYPKAPGDIPGVAGAIARLAKDFGVTEAQVTERWHRFAEIRAKLARLDTMTWRDDVVSGFENHSSLVSATDMGGDPEGFEIALDALIARCAERAAFKDEVRLALFGVPPILSDLYAYLEARAARVVLNETQRDFAQIPSAPGMDEHYATRFAYPYSIHARLGKFLPELSQRRVDAVLVYAQSFCHHNVELPAVRRALASAGLPFVVLDADLPGLLDGAQRLRLDTLLTQAGRRPSPVGVSSEATASCPRPIVGLDIGSRRAKIVLLEGDRVSRRIAMDTVPFLRDLVAREDGHLSLKSEALAETLEISSGELADARIVTTGYGRDAVRIEGTMVFPEIHAHAAGASFQSGLDTFVLVDLGGQDVKVIRVERARFSKAPDKGPGQVADFVMNDKCAAGSGRYLENMARLLEMPLETLLEQELDPVDITATCATFGETEVISRLMQGASPERIAAGVNRSVVARLLPVVRRMGDAPLLLSGGASGRAITHMLTEAIGRQATPLGDPVFNGAIGCARLALDAP